MPRPRDNRCCPGGELSSPAGAAGSTAPSSAASKQTVPEFLPTETRQGSAAAFPAACSPAASYRTWVLDFGVGKIFRKHRCSSSTHSKRSLLLRDPLPAVRLGALVTSLLWAQTHRREAPFLRFFLASSFPRSCSRRFHLSSLLTRQQRAGEQKLSGGKGVGKGRSCERWRCPDSEQPELGVTGKHSSTWGSSPAHEQPLTTAPAGWTSPRPRLLPPLLLPVRARIETPLNSQHGLSSSSPWR